MKLGDLKENDVFEWTSQPGYYYHRGKDDGPRTCTVYYIGTDPTATTVIKTVPDRSFDLEVNRVHVQV